MNLGTQTNKQMNKQTNINVQSEKANQTANQCTKIRYTHIQNLKINYKK